MKLGRIGKLQMIVPWRSLSSSPVEVVITNVYIILSKSIDSINLIAPQTKQEWELIETFHTNFKLKDDMITQFATQLYTQLIVIFFEIILVQKTQEAEQQEQGFFKSLVTKIIDNVQLTIQNIHVRLESQDKRDNMFSLGFTLKELTVHTTNQDWDREYFDRTREVNQDKPIFKVLNIVKFGFYWRTNEDKFLTQDYTEEDDMLIEMRQLFQQQEDYIEDYKSFYLLQPISLYMKLKQNIAALTLEKEPEYTVSLDVDDFSIYLQKNQYDNLIKLMELFNDYTRFQDLYQQTRKYKFLRPQSQTPKTDPRGWLKFCGECVCREIRQNRAKINQFIIESRQRQRMKNEYQEFFKKILQFEIRNLEQPEKYQTKNREDFWTENNNQRKAYQYITQAIEVEDLEAWVTEIAKSLAEEFKEKEKEKQLNANTGGGFLSYFTSIGTSWLGGSQELEEQKGQIQQSQTENSSKQLKSNFDDSFRSDKDSEGNQDDDEFYDALDEIPGQPDNQKQKSEGGLTRRKTSIEDEMQVLRQSLLINFAPQSFQKQHQSPRKKFSEQAVLDLIRLNSQVTDQQKEALRDDALAKQIPFVLAAFTLKSFSVSLVNNDQKQEGIELYSKNFMIDFKKFETNNTQNLFTFELIAKNEAFGVNQIHKIENQSYKTSIISSSQNADQIAQLANSYQSVVRLIKGNLNQNVSHKTVVDENIDFDLDVKFQPLQVVYQVKAINKLVKFLKIKSSKDEELKLQAYEKLEALKQSVSITDVLKNRKKNRIKVEIASPIIILPFKKNNDINSECWIFNMGDLSIQNYDNKNDPSLIKNFDSYKIQFTQIMMRYVRSYKQWLTNESQSYIEVIKPFKTSLILQLKRRSDTVNTQEAEIVAIGKMSKLSIFFTPHIYNSILNISLLLSSSSSQKEQDQHQMINEKNEVLQISTKQGLIRKQGNTIKFWYSYYGVLSGGYIYFYEKQSDIYPSEYYFIKGCQIIREFDSKIDHSILLINMYGELCVVAFNNQKMQQEWEKAISDKVSEYSLQGQENQLQRQSLLAEKKYSKEDLESKMMRFEFQMPEIAIDLQAESQSNTDQNCMSDFNSQEFVGTQNDLKHEEEFDIGLFTPMKKIRDSSVSIQKDTDFQRQNNNPFQESHDKDLKFDEHETIKDTRWESKLNLSNIKINYVRRLYDSDINVVLQSLSVSNYKNERFAEMISSEYQILKKALIEINVLKQEKESPRYQNQDMNVDLQFGQMTVYWHPKSLNRIIRFFRYYKLPSVFMQEEREKLRQKQNLYQPEPMNLDAPFAQRLNSEKIQIQNCQTFPNILVKVNVKLDLLKIVLIHPINETYPITSLMLGKFKLDYEMNVDHDNYNGSFGELKIYDHTNFPLTLDPRRRYNNPEYPNHEILGLRSDFKTDTMFTFSCILHHEAEERICPKQVGQFDKQVKLGLNGIKINYLQEPMMRINDYFFSQFLGALSDANPYQKIIDEQQNEQQMNSPASAQIKRESISSFKFYQQLEGEKSLGLRTDKKPAQKLFSFLNVEEINNQNDANFLQPPLTERNLAQTQSPQFRNNLRRESTNYVGQSDTPITFNKYQMSFEANKNDTKKQIDEKDKNFVWNFFDLQQYQFCTSLDITIDRPLIVLKDRPYLSKNIEIDLGKTNITSETLPVMGRWKSLAEKEVWVTRFNIDMKDMGIRFDNGKFEIAPSFDLKIVFEKLNHSPYLEDSYNSKNLDFVELDISYKININFSAFIMHLKQDVYTYLLRCIDLNVNYTDNMTKYFQLAIWNDGSDTQKYLTQEQEMIKKHRNKEVYKMKIYMTFPSLSLQLRNNDDSFMSEMILWSSEIDFLKYLDYRKTIIVKAHTLYILHNEQIFDYGTKMKQVVVAPVSSKNYVCTNQDFYNFQHSQSISKLSPQKRAKAHQKLAKKNFVVNMHLEADGEKLIQTKIEKLKIFIKPHIFLMMFELFVYSMPQYQEESRDKPNFFDSDYGNAPRMEVCCQILQSLLCFENEEKYQKTIACQGNTSFTYIREKLNQIKLRLIDKPNTIDDLAKDDNQSQNSSRKGSISFQSTQQIDQSATTKIMQVSISDLCPFFCSGTDLDGKNFKQVRKREMMSPFTLFYNRSDIIELTKMNDRLFLNSPDRYVFKNYSKVEANLERTLLKVSFNDVQILKGIVDHLGQMLSQEQQRIASETKGEEELEIQDSDNDEEDYLKIYADSGSQRKTSSKSVKFGAAVTTNARRNTNLHQIDELTELSQNFTIHEKPDDSYLTSDSSDYENEEETKSRLEKIRKSREIVLKSKKTSSNKVDNFSESVKRASMAFSKLTETFTQRQQEFIKKQEQENKQDERKLPYGVVKQKSRQYQGDTISEEDDEGMDDLDIEEGVCTNIDQHYWNNLSPNASKTLMTISDADSINQNLMSMLQFIKEERGVDQFQVVSYGLKVLIINDYLQNFFPVLGISISEFHYSSDQNETQKAGITQFSSAINYYNAEAGEWEPFIETFKIHFTIMEEFKNQKRMLQCELPQNLGINITEKLVKNLTNTYKSWLSSSEESEEIQERKRTLGSAYEPVQSDRGGCALRRRASSYFKQYAFEDIDEEDELDPSQKEEDLVTPYSICNQTNQKLLVKRLNNLEGDITEHNRKKSVSKFQPANLLKNSSGHQQSKLNKVYVINPGEAIDYAVDYELQVRQQMNIYNSHQFSGQQGEFIKILFEDAGTSLGGITSGTGMSIPLSSVNLNQVGCKKHFVKDDEKSRHSEFYVYGVSQVNMKKVLTIRTQYLFVNQTFFTYEVHIRFQNSSIIRTLAPGDKLPIPDTINNCLFQIRIASQQNHIENEEFDNDIVTPQLGRRTSKKQNSEVNDSMILDDYINQKGDIKDFRQISKSWSDQLPIVALKRKLPVDCTTFLAHGKTFTIIKKEKSEFQDAYDITLRPPLLLKNCLPVPIFISFEDSNGDVDSFDLLKEEEKHVFVFKLQQPVMIKVQIDGFREQLVVLDCQNQKDIEIKVQCVDNFGRTLDLYVATSTKVAGKKAIFYVKNCLINNTQQNLTFFYSQPTERQIKSKNSKDSIAGIDDNEFNGKKVFLLSDVKFKYLNLLQKQEVFGSIDGSLEVSNPINIFNPGCNDKFMLTRGNLLFEFAYQTEIFLATKDNYIYSKITTITPLYVFVNNTKSVLIASQLDSLDIPFVIPSKERAPFHWADKTKERFVCIKIINDQNYQRFGKQEIEYRWSSGFDIAQLGQISIQMREVQKDQNNQKDQKKFKAQRQKLKYLKVDRRLHNNTIFIIVEEEDSSQPAYKIENFSKFIALRYHQVEQHEQADLLNCSETTPFSWSNHLGQHELEVDLFHGDLNNDHSFYIQGVQLRFALDQLNQKYSYLISVGYQETITLHVCTFTNGYTKVIRFSDVDNSDITATNQEDKKEEVDENSQQMSIYEINLKQLNFSMIGENKELLVFYFQRIQAKVVDTEKDTKSEFEIGYFQIDNQSQNDPIYPVMVKPKYIKPEFQEEDENSQQLQKKDHFRGYQIGVFQLSLDFRKNIPHVAYFELVDYLLQTLEVKLEFSHILLLSKFVQKIGTMLNKNLTYMHQIFEQDWNENQEDLEPDFFRMKDSSTRNQDYAYQYSERSRQDTFSSQQLDRFQSEVMKIKSNFEDEDDRQDEEVKLHLTSHHKSMKLQRFQSQDQATINRTLQKKNTVASSLNFNRNQSLRDPPKRGSLRVEFKNSLVKQKTSKQQIMMKLQTQDYQILHQQTKVQRQTWKSEQFQPKTQRLYIKEYRAGPVELEVSIMNTESFEFEEQDIFKTVSSLGLVLSSIEEAPIKLNALMLENVFGDYDDVIDQIKKHHSERLKWNILKFIGASNLLGNPSNFVNALGTGVQDFFYQPRQGFVKGPIQGGIGIIKGTGSLVKNTLIGTIGSASKMVSSVSKGLLVLSNDKEYIQKRDVENIKKKPQNVGQGLSFGLKSALYSIKSGITGVYKQPIEESKKSGFSGFFKGTAKGITGLVVKPISGTLDLFSLTSEGIKNTSKKVEELIQDKRLRLPRPFYETERMIREYDEFHAFWVNQVPRLSAEISVDYFFEATMIDSSEVNWSILFITSTHIAMIVADYRTQQQKQVKNPVFIKWCYETKMIEYAEVVEESLLTIGFKDKNLSIQLHDQIIAEKVRSKIEKIIKIQVE